MSTIKAVTFDLWDTLVDDESDEPKRRAQGLRSKAEERRYLIWDALNRQQPIGLDEVCKAYDVSDAAFNKVWKELHVTWTVADRLAVLFKGMARPLPPKELDALVQALSTMEVDIPPEPIPGVGKALKELAGQYKLSIVSDAVFTPGTNLRSILESYGLKQYFSAFAFSDEVGYSKPHRSMFDSAARQLGVNVDEMVHVGDRDHNDVKGPQALGMKAVLFTATRDADANATTADAICASFADLPAVIGKLAARAE